MSSFTSLWHTAHGILRRPFTKDVLTLQIGSVFVIGIGFLKSVLYARVLGLDLFGVYATVLAFTGTASIFTNLGQNQAALTFFAEKFARKDRAGMCTVLKYYLVLSCAGAAILLGLSIVASPLSIFFYGNASIGKLASLAFLAIFAGSFDTYFTIQLQTTRAIRTLTILENINLILQFIFTAAALLAGFGIAGMFVGLFVSNVVMLCVYIGTSEKYLRNKNIPSVQEALRYGGSVRPLIRQGLWISADKNIGNLFPQSFFFVLSLFSTPATVGIAQLAFKIGSLPKILLLPHIVRMGTTVLPAIHARTNDFSQLRHAWALMVKHALVIHALISFGSLFVLPPLTILLYGWQFADTVIPAIWLLLIQIISALNVGNSPLFRMLGKAHISALFGSVALPLQLLSFIILLQFLPSIHAFVWTVFLIYVSNLWLNMRLYQELKKTA